MRLTLRETGPSLESMYQFMTSLVPTVEKFPRSQKFLLGDRIRKGFNCNTPVRKLHAGEVSLFSKGGYDHLQCRPG